MNEDRPIEETEVEPVPLACPFCGSEVSLEKDDDTGFYLIECYGCGITTDKYYYSETIVEKWNRRVTGEQVSSDEVYGPGGYYDKGAR